MFKNKLILLFFILFILTSCSKYAYVLIDYPLKPVVDLPTNIDTITVINRSLLNKEDSKNKVLKSVVIGEVISYDKLTSDECIKGVFDGARRITNINIVILDKIKYYGTGTREMLDLLEWNIVSMICDSNNANALLVLENFDSNTDLLISTATKQTKAILNTGSPKPALPQQINMSVICYWKLYEPTSQKIIDQYQQTFHKTINTKGIALPADALYEAAYYAGIEYIQRFLPDYYTY